MCLGQKRIPLKEGEEHRHDHRRDCCEAGSDPISYPLLWMNSNKQTIIECLFCLIPLLGGWIKPIWVDASHGRQLWRGLWHLMALSRNGVTEGSQTSLDSLQGNFSTVPWPSEPEKQSQIQRPNVGSKWKEMQERRNQGKRGTSQETKQNQGKMVKGSSHE